MNEALGAIDNRVVADLSVSVWDRRKQLLYVDGSACTARQNSPTPEHVNCDVIP